MPEIPCSKENDLSIQHQRKKADETVQKGKDESWKIWRRLEEKGMEKKQCNCL